MNINQRINKLSYVIKKSKKERMMNLLNKYSSKSSFYSFEELLEDLISFDLGDVTIKELEDLLDHLSNIKSFDNFVEKVHVFLSDLEELLEDDFTDDLTLSEALGEVEEDNEDYENKDEINDVEDIKKEAKHKPTNSKLWNQAIAAAKKKFDKYPSAYANLWASKYYKSKGGSWKKEKKSSSEFGLIKNAIELKITISPELQYHIDNGLDLRSNIFRPGSEKFCNLFNEVRELCNNGHYNPSPIEKWYLSTDIGCYGDYEGQKVPLDLPMLEEDDYEREVTEEDTIDSNDENDDENNAEYHGKKVELNKPKRGGSKKFYVYVKDPKTKKVKKVSFGQPGMSVGTNSSKRRKSFRARHKCDQKKDKTTAGYWACRISRYPSATGGKKKKTWW